MKALLWESWSRYALRTAASILKRPVEGVIPTTNHLESFNNSLKNTHLPQYAHGKARLRLDVFVLFLINGILPDMHTQRYIQEQYALWRKQRFSLQSSASSGSGATEENVPVALPPGLDRLATKPLATGSIMFEKMMGIVCVCASSDAACVADPVGDFPDSTVPLRCACERASAT